MIISLTNPDKHLSRVFGSVDPAPPAKKDYTTAQLKERLLDSSLGLFERYFTA